MLTEPVSPAARPQTSAMRWLLLVASVLVFMAGFQLYVLSAYTERYFAWTINPPLTAAFLGAAYWASFALELMASRARLWANGRIAVPAVLLFTTLTLIATWLHFAPPFQLHLDSPNIVTRLAAVAWIGVYGVVPPVMLVVLWLQLRIPGDDPPRAAPLPGRLRYAYSLLGALMLACGVLMFLVPQAGITIWPWTLSPLTSRAIGAWLIGLGTAAVHLVWENDFGRVRPAIVGTVIFGLLELVALARYPTTVAWNGVSAWLYVLFLLSLIVVGGLGLAAAPQAHQT